MAAPVGASRRRGELALHVQERRAGDVAREIELAAAFRLAELPPAIDELVAQAESLRSYERARR